MKLKTPGNVKIELRDEKRKSKWGIKQENTSQNGKRIERPSKRRQGKMNVSRR